MPGSVSANPAAATGKFQGAASAVTGGVMKEALKEGLKIEESKQREAKKYLKVSPQRLRNGKRSRDTHQDLSHVVIVFIEFRLARPPWENTY